MIIHGDCIEEMKKLEPNSVDAIITDPPYGLEFMGKSWDKFKDAKNIAGGTSHGTPFNRQEDRAMPSFHQLSNLDKLSFQEFTKEWAKEALRVLKPGGYLLSFGGTRTYHRMTCGIEDAGFEIRDCIGWVFGSGFPKSLNVSKSIDKMKGLKREVLEERRTIPNSSSWETDKGMLAVGEQNFDVTLPNSPEAKEWEGWGTALKPAWESICVARKPLSEKNVALNVLKWGTGGINIDESRIGTKGGTKHEEGEKEYNNEIYGKGLYKEFGKEIPNLGRFPANIIFECICDELIEGETIGKDLPEDNSKSNAESQIYGFAKYENMYKSGKHYQDKILTHTNPNCPCYMLDEQSGISKSSDAIRYNNQKQTSMNSPIYGVYNDYEGKGFNDKGGASRFFYVAKASKSERILDSYVTIKFIKSELLNKLWQEENTELVELLKKVILEWGINNFNIVISGENIMVQCHKDSLSIIKMEINKTTELKILNLLQLWSIKGSTQTVNLKTDNGLKNVQNAANGNQLQKNSGILQRKGGFVITDVANAIYELLLKINNKKEEQAYSNHPTHKPIKLIEYLIKLVSCEGSVILDPFLGSGTTAIACIKTNRNFIGIEKESDYIKIAEARINAWREKIEKENKINKIQTKL